MTFSIIFLIGIGLVGIALLGIAAWVRSLDLTLFGIFCFIASVVSLGFLLLQ